MNDNIPNIELPQFATRSLARSVEVARDAVSLRVGYDVELACLEPVERDGHLNMRIRWRRKPVALSVVADRVMVPQA
jgi:hypothetical protein